MPETLLRAWRVVFARMLAIAAAAVIGAPLHAAEHEPPMLELEPGSHAAFVRRLAVDPALGIAVSASDDKTARVWDLASGAIRHVLRPPIGQGERGRLYGAALHPTRRIVALGGTTRDEAGRHWIYLFDVDSGRMTAAFDAHGGDVRRLAWSADGTVLFAAYAGDNGVRAFDANGRPIFEERFGAPGFGLAVSAQGLVAATGMDGRVRLYRAQAGRVEALRSITTASEQAVSVAFSPDGGRIAVGFFAPGAGVEVLDSGSGARIARLALPRLEAGYLMTVAWSRDGRVIHAGGSAYQAGNRFPVYSYDAGSGAIVREDIVASNTIYDIAPLPGAAYAFASGDGTVGIVDANATMRAFGPRIADLRGAQNLRISGDAMRVRWTSGFGAQPASFDFSTRLVTRGEAADVRAAVTRRGFFGATSRVENVERPEIAGKAFALQPGEVSRALAYLGEQPDVALATSRALYRIGVDGRTVWRTATNTEVWAVNASDDGRLIVGALADGTIRWWRASDGAALLSLYTAADGRWVSWTPNGYFDASAGADRLVGWTVNRGAAAAADFFSLSRFRERMNRPDVIDRVLSTADVAVAIAQADRAAARAAAEAVASTASAAPVAPPAPAPAAAPTVPAAHASLPSALPPARPAEPVVVASVVAPTITIAQLPPSLAAVESTLLKTAERTISLPFTIRSPGGNVDIEIEVRIDGRPTRVDAVSLPQRLDGMARGLARLQVPSDGGLVQLFARNKNGASEPLNFVVERPEPIALPSAPAISVPVAPAPAAQASAPARPILPPVAAPRSRLFVLSIGVSDYQRTEYRLGLAAKDARDFAAAMQRQQGRLYREVVARTITDRQATRAEVHRGLAWLADAAGPDDIAMLFVAGHGLNEPAGQYYFLPYDGQHERLAATSVPERSIRETLARIRGKALFFVDTCFAGNVIGTFRSASRELARLANDLAASENGVVVFASSSGRQLSEEKDEWGNGAFTKALIEGLSGKADLTNTGRVTFKGLDFFVSEEVRKLTEGRQTPVTISPAGVPDFVLARI